MAINWWMLGIQAVNVVILIWLLARFFWRPIAAIIEQRRSAAQQIWSDAETKESQATDALARIEQTRAGFEIERQAIIAAAHKAAVQARAAILASAAKEAATLEAAAEAAIKKERSAADKAWAERANLLGIEIARRLVGRLDCPVVSSAFLDWLLREIRALPDSVRDAVAAAGVTLKVVSASPIDPANQERHRTLIGDAFGTHPKITFQVDPALIAGLELRGPHLVVNNSWRADLARIRAELAA